MTEKAKSKSAKPKSAKPKSSGLENRRAQTPENSETANSVKAAAVADYLRRNPDFLIENPDLMDVLSPPSRSAGTVVDMQHFMLHRLRDENARLREGYDQLIHAARSNQSTLTRVHGAALTVLGARSFEGLIQAVTTDLAVLLDLDAVTLCVEAGDVPVPKAYSAGVRSLPAGTINATLGPDQDVLLGSEMEKGDRRLFGAAAGLIRSQALVRLDISTQAPTGLLVLGSRREDEFSQGQGTELLGFLARALEITIRQWLSLPG